MALRGNLSEASLADVLQLLALGQKTGCLSVAREGGFGTVHFAGGRIVHAELVSRRDRLGDRLVRVGAITPDALARVTAASAPQDDRELAHALLAAGLLAREQLVGAYRTQVEEAVYHLFSWSLGSFTFEPEADHLPDTALVSMSADSLLLEGARRVDEWTQIAKQVPSLDLIFELDGARLARRAVPLSATQERIRTFLDGTQDLNTAIERSGLGEFEVWVMREPALKGGKDVCLLQPHGSGTAHCQNEWKTKFGAVVRIELGDSGQLGCGALGQTRLGLLLG